MHNTYHCNNVPLGNDRERTICGSSTILPIQTVTRTTRRVNQDSKETSRCNGGGTFCCISLVLTFMILLLVQLLVWRFFDIDILPVDDSIANHEMSNSSIHMIANDLDWFLFTATKNGFNKYLLHEIVSIWKSSYYVFISRCQYG